MPPHNTAAAGAQGLTADLRSMRMVPLGDEKYLWALVVLEVVALGLLRGAFKRHHGG